MTHPRPDPSLLPVERPRCPQCHQRMHFTRAVAGLPGLDLRNFECAKCEVFVTKTVATDPMHSEATRWLSGDLKPPE